MTQTRDPRILVIGQDASLHIAITSAFPHGRHLYLPDDVSETDMFTGAAEADVVVVHCAGDAEASIPLLRRCNGIGIQRKTVVLADPNDRTIARYTVALGLAAFVGRNTDARRLVNVIDHVANGGVFLDGAAADAFGYRIDLTTLDPAGRVDAARSLAYALEMKDAYTGGHAERVAAMAMRLAAEAKLDEALPSEVLETAFLLHDVGKIGIPESILGKPGRLTPGELTVMQSHPLLGEKVVEPLRFPIQTRDVVRHHHEKWDGSGYPERLSGTEIPPAARLFAIADALDAMTSLRPYRKPIAWEAALDEVLSCAGTHFDPDLAVLAKDLFLSGPSPAVEAQ